MSMLSLPIPREVADGCFASLDTNPSIQLRSTTDGLWRESHPKMHNLEHKHRGKHLVSPEPMLEA